MDVIHDKVECKKTNSVQADTSAKREHDRRALGGMTVILEKSMLTRLSMEGTLTEHTDTIQHGGNTDPDQ